jgi:hypothetical protein
VRDCTTIAKNFSSSRFISPYTEPRVRDVNWFLLQMALLTRKLLAGFLCFLQSSLRAQRMPCLFKTLIVLHTRRVFRRVPPMKLVPCDFVSH